YNIDVNKTREFILKETIFRKGFSINKRTKRKIKAIIPVHVYGHPAQMNKIMEIAQRYGLHIIEDAAEAHGAKIFGRSVGSWGICGTFSFYGNKIITTGEGGMVTTNDESLYLRLRTLRDHAMSKEKKYWHEIIGFNYRMTNIQAAIGCAQMERASELIADRKRVFERYKNNLGEYKYLTLNRRQPWAENVYWLICLECNNFNEIRRNDFMDYLKKNGVDCRPYFYPISDMGIYSRANTPVTHKVHSLGINIPTFYSLSNEDIDYVSEICMNYTGYNA
ncbi:MAG: DegT/DnrJ/EryC1/StrS family aminotransferase, partial [Oligoflexales bacterium]|nr:DegT/DnrJ/EryC1/StrS family aminotransferase [Oligoflexales bacterium]